MNIESIIAILGTLTTIAIGQGAPLAVGVLVIVSALRFSGLVTDGNQARRANLIVGVVLAAMWYVSTVLPQYAPYIETAYTAIIASAVAGLGYEGISWLVSQYNSTRNKTG